MDETVTQSSADPANRPAGAEDGPPGDHPLEVAARRGIGPLSAKAQAIWHGDAKPCVSCGLIVLRDQRECDHCGQDLGDEMIEKMRAHAGPWYVFEHLRPFPGVSLERIIRQIRRGVLTETSIVRGPSTDFQWRFAVETPGLCRYFSKCWKCQGTVSASDAYCPSCLAYLSHDTPVPAQSASPPAGDSATADAPHPTAELQELSAAVHGPLVPKRESVWDDPPRIGPFRAIWVAVAVIALAIAALLWFTRVPSPSTQRPAPRPIGWIHPLSDSPQRSALG